MLVSLLLLHEIHQNTMRNVTTFSKTIVLLHIIYGK